MQFTFSYTLASRHDPIYFSYAIYEFSSFTNCWLSGFTIRLFVALWWSRERKFLLFIFFFMTHNMYIRIRERWSSERKKIVLVRMKIIVWFISIGNLIVFSLLIKRPTHGASMNLVHGSWHSKFFSRLYLTMYIYIYSYATSKCLKIWERHIASVWKCGMVLKQNFIEWFF